MCEKSTWIQFMACMLLQVAMHSPQKSASTGYTGWSSACESAVFSDGVTCDRRSSISVAPLLLEGRPHIPLQREHEAHIDYLATSNVEIQVYSCVSASQRRRAVTGCGVSPGQNVRASYPYIGTPSTHPYSVQNLADTSSCTLHAAQSLAMLSFPFLFEIRRCL